VGDDNGFKVEIDAPVVLECEKLPSPAGLRRAVRGARLRQRLEVELPTKLGFGRRAATAFIRFYQRFISVRGSRRCVLEPSCSRYAELAIAHNGVIAGVIETWHRLHRCRPENEGTIDYPEGVKFCHTK
jgi:putative membrane protein insertion efficiency factor